MYGSSPKVKCREGMCDVFQWIAELQIPSRDRVLISPRSCVDFAEIVCRFCQVIDWGTLEIGSDFLEKIFTEVENCRGRKSKSRRNGIQKSAAAETAEQKYGRPARSTVGRSSGSVDRRARRHAQVAVDRSGRPQKEIGRRAVDRLKCPNSRLGTVDRPSRPVHRVGRPAGRPTIESACFRKGLF